MLIRQQRHFGIRILIATQEPTLDTRLLDLCNVSIVHNFASRAWFNALKGHLAGTSGKEADHDRIFRRIVKLNTGSALLFSPRAMLHVENSGVDGSGRVLATKLGDSFVEIDVRQRITFDGGLSITAEDKQEIKEKVDLPLEDTDASPTMSFDSSSGGMRIATGSEDSKESADGMTAPTSKSPLTETKTKGKFLP